MTLRRSIADPKDIDRGPSGGRSSWRRAVTSVHGRPAPATIQSRLEPLHDIVEILGPVWDARGRLEGPRRAGRALEVTHQASARAAQARRDGRGPGVRGGPQEGPGGQSERPVDRDPFAAPPRCAGDRSAANPKVALGHDPHPHASATENRTMRRTMIRYAATVVGRVAPADRPLRLRPRLRRRRRSPHPRRPSGRRGQGRDACPSVKFVDVTKDAGITFVHNNGGDRREALARDDGRRRGLPRLRQRRRSGPVLRQLVAPGRATTSSRPRPRPSTATTARDTFEDVTKEAGLDKTFYGQGVAVGDYDNDGDPDLYVTAIGRRLPVPQRRQGTLRGRDRIGQRQGAQRLAHRRRVPRHRQRRRSRPVHRQLHHLDARDRQGAGLPAHRDSAGRTARRRRSAARSAPLAQRRRAGSPTSARRRASRSGRPT